MAYGRPFASLPADQSMPKINLLNLIPAEADAALDAFFRGRGEPLYRARQVARPRQVAMYLAKQLTARSLPEIGRKFGGRDHTTVMHAVSRIEELRGMDSAFAEDIDLLRRMLES